MTVADLRAAKFDAIVAPDTDCSFGFTFPTDVSGWSEWTARFRPRRGPLVVIDVDLDDIGNDRVVLHVPPEQVADLDGATDWYFAAFDDEDAPVSIFRGTFVVDARGGAGGVGVEEISVLFGDTEITLELRQGTTGTGLPDVGDEGDVLTVEGGEWVPAPPSATVEFSNQPPLQAEANANSGEVDEAARIDHIHPLEVVLDVEQVEDDGVVNVAMVPEPQFDEFGRVTDWTLVPIAIGEDQVVDLPGHLAALEAADTAHASIVDGTVHGIGALIASEVIARNAAIAQAIADLIASAPGALNTLDELAAALGDDANFAATVTSALAGKQGIDATLTALAGLSTQADRGVYFTATDVAAVFTLTAFARSLLDDADADTFLSTLGATTVGKAVFAATNTAAGRTALGLGTAAVLDVPASGDAASGEVVKGNDSRLTNSRAPSGSAGGDLTGTYPNPTLTTSGVTAGTKGSATTSAVVTVNAKGLVTGLSELPLVIPKFGGFLSEGHSWTQFDGDGGVVGVNASYPKRAAAALGVPYDDALLLGKSGAVAGQPLDPALGTIPGIGGALRIGHPNHWYTGGRAARNTSKMRGFAHLISLHLNDEVYYFSDNNAIVSFEHGLRTLLAWRRLAQLWLADDGTITYTGTWSTLTDRLYTPGDRYKQTVTNTDSFTITVPTTLIGTTWLDVFLLGTPNGQTNLTSQVNSGATSYPVANRSMFPSSGNFYIRIGSSNIQITGGHGTGAGSLTGAAAPTTFATSSVVRRPANTATITWSGTAANATGTTIVAGQGNTGESIQMVKRFAVTAADAGKTIIGTLSGLVDGEGLRVLGYGLEDQDPPTQRVLDMPDADYSGVWAVATPAVNASFRTVMSNVCAEFTNAPPQVVALKATFDALFGATWQATASADNSGNNHTGQTVHITPNDASQCVIDKGSILRGQGEEMLVTAITKTSTTDWSLTVTRNYTGTDAATGASATLTNVAHTSGAAVYDSRPWSVDRVHPSDLGHELFASAVILSYAAASQTALQVANGGGLNVRRRQTWKSGGYVYAPGPRTTRAMTQNKLWVVPIYIPNDGVIKTAGVSVSTLQAASTVRLGLYTDGNGAPGALVAEFGSVAGTSAVFVEASTWIPVRAGWYWAASVGQGAAPTIRGINDIPVGYIIPDTSAGADTASEPHGFSDTGYTGALPSTLVGVSLTRETGAVPLVYLQLLTASTD